MCARAHSSWCGLHTASCIFTKHSHTRMSVAVTAGHCSRVVAGYTFLLFYRRVTGMEKKKKSGLDPLHTRSHASPPTHTHTPSSTVQRLYGTVRDSLLQRLGRALRYTYGRKITHSGGSGGLYKLPASIHV